VCCIYDLTYKYLFISGIKIDISDDENNDHGCNETIVDDQTPETKALPPSTMLSTILAVYLIYFR
jgi:hypothetical protein